MSDEIDSIIAQISCKPGVIGLIVATKDGLPVKSTLPMQETGLYSLRLSEILLKSRLALDDLLPNQQIKSFRIRSFKNEFIVIPDGNYFLIILQDSVADSKKNS